MDIVEEIKKIAEQPLSLEYIKISEELDKANRLVKNKIRNRVKEIAWAIMRLSPEDSKNHEAEYMLERHLYVNTYYFDESDSTCSVEIEAQYGYEGTKTIEFPTAWIVDQEDNWLKNLQAEADAREAAKVAKDQADAAKKLAQKEERERKQFENLKQKFGA